MKNISQFIPKKLIFYKKKIFSSDTALPKWLPVGQGNHLFYINKIISKSKFLPMKIKRIHFVHIFITPVYLYWDFIGVLKGKHFLRLGPGGLVVCVSDGSSCTRNRIFRYYPESTKR